MDGAAVSRQRTGKLRILTNVFHIANPPQWFISSKWALKGIIMMSVWHDVGYYCIILLANMQGLSAEVYESAAVDLS